MNPVLRNFACLVVAVVLNLFLANWLHIAWCEALINNRIFTVYGALISAGDLLSWLFYVVFFFASGLLLASALNSSRAWFWGLSLGVCYSLLVYFLGSEWISPDAGLHVYLARAGEYVMPPFGGFLGALIGSRLRSRRSDPNGR